MKNNRPIVLVQIGYSKYNSMNQTPLGIWPVGSALKGGGFDVHLVHITELEIEGKVDEILALDPLFIGLSVMTGPQTKHSADMSKMLKERGIEPITVVWGGLHPSLLPEQCLAEDYIDIVVIGEGEVTAIELAEKLSAGDSIEDVKGIGFTRKGGEVQINSRREFIRNMDDYRYDFSIIDVDRYIHREDDVERMFEYKSSRGCPFNCGFCYNREFNHNKWRGFSTKAVIEDIEFLKKEYNIDGIKFFDDNFYVQKKRALEILEAIDLTFHTEIRIDQIDEDTAKRLSSLRSKELLIGLESGSDNTLELLTKGYSVDKAIEGVELLSKYGLKANYSTIVGFPWEPDEEWAKTIDLMIRVKEIHPQADFTLGVYLPYPGSLLYQEALKSGFKPPDRTEDWGNLDRWEEFNSPWIDTKKIYLIRKAFHFASLGIGPIYRLMMFRLKNRRFEIPLDISLFDYLYEEGTHRKSFIGGIAKRFYYMFTTNPTAQDANC